MQQSPDKIGKYLIDHQLTISVAESVTAGCLQTRLSILKDARLFFQGGITVYNCGQKARHLNIEPIYALKCNAVDLSITIKMAHEVCRLFCSEVGVSTTGYAAPLPEEHIGTPFSYYAIVYKNKLIASGKLTAVSTCYGLEVQQEFAERVLEVLAQELIREQE